MAQLIKLQDYVSRYETDIFRYSSQYVRLKKKHLQGIESAFNSDNEQENPIEDHPLNEQILSELTEENDSFFHKIRRFFKREDKLDHETNFLELQTGRNTPKTVEEQKEIASEEIYQFQLRWASTTLREKSFFDTGFKNDMTLKYFSQSFPDNYLLMYKPIFVVKNAPVECEIVLISPINTWILSLLESSNGAVFKTDKGRFWVEGHGDDQKKRLNPILGINRTAKIINTIYEQSSIQLPIKKAVISRTGFIEKIHISQDIEFIDRRTYHDWHERLKRLPSPLKFVQLKAAQELLKYSQSTYIKRREWEETEEEFD